MSYYGPDYRRQRRVTDLLQARGVKVWPDEDFSVVCLSVNEAEKLAEALRAPRSDRNPGTTDTPRRTEEPEERDEEGLPDRIRGLRRIAVAVAREAERQGNPEALAETIQALRKLDDVEKAAYLTGLPVETIRRVTLTEPDR